MKKGHILITMAILVIVAVAVLPVSAAKTTTTDCGTNLIVSKPYDITQTSFRIDVSKITGRYVWVSYGLTNAAAAHTLPNVKARFGKAKIQVTMKSSYEYGKYIYYKVCDIRGCSDIKKIQLRYVADPMRPDPFHLTR